MPTCGDTRSDGEGRARDVATVTRINPPRIDLDVGVPPAAARTSRSAARRCACAAPGPPPMPRRYGARMTRVVSTLAAAVAALLVVAPAADALIQVDRGIAGARIGNSQAQVRAALGAPTRVNRGTNDFGRFVVFRYAAGLQVTFQDGGVSTASTTGLGDRTAKGVGVGSTEAAADRVSGVRCESIGGDRICHTNEFAGGQRVTSFIIRGGKVARVDVGVVFD
jgi:hypothetical protein